MKTLKPRTEELMHGLSHYVGYIFNQQIMEIANQWFSKKNHDENI